MKKFNASDFENGEEVYHTTNSRLMMAIIGTNSDSNEVTCQWVDTTGKSNKETFSAAVIKKWAGRIPISNTYLPIKRSNNHW